MYNKINKKCRCNNCGRCSLRDKMKSTIERNAVNEETRSMLLNKKSKARRALTGTKSKKTSYNIDIDKKTGKWVAKSNDTNKTLVEGTKEHIACPRTGKLFLTTSTQGRILLAAKNEGK